MSRPSAIAVGIVITLLNVLEGVYGNVCPSSYPFDSCPRVTDPSYYSTCCTINGYPQCCDTTILATWAMGVIIVTCLLVIGVISLIFCACCPCCWLASRRRRSQYIVVSQENPPTYPAAAATRTTYVYSYPNPNSNPPAYQPPPPNTATANYIKE